MDVTLFGKMIGEAVDCEEIDNLAVRFIDFEPNDEGKKFLRNVEIPYHRFDMTIDFIVGIVQLGSGYNETVKVNVDWSVFNK